MGKKGERVKMNVTVCDFCGKRIVGDYYTIQVMKNKKDFCFDKGEYLFGDLCDECYEILCNMLKTNETIEKPSIDSIIEEMREAGWKIKRKGETDVHQ